MNSQSVLIKWGIIAHVKTKKILDCLENDVQSTYFLECPSVIKSKIYVTDQRDIAN